MCTVKINTSNMTHLRIERPFNHEMKCNIHIFVIEFHKQTHFIINDKII